MKAGNVLEDKERFADKPLVTIEPESTILDAVHLLCQNRIGALLVTDAEKHLVGIITERDVLAECCRNHKNIDATRVDSAMTREVIVAHPQDDVQDILRIMTTKRVRHMPIVENDKISGMLSIGDILRRLYKQDELKIRYLSDYLGGTYGLKVY